MIRSVKNFLRDEEGAVAIEYALVAAGIAGIVYAFFSSDTAYFKTLLTDLYNKIASAASGN